MKSLPLKDIRLKAYESVASLYVSRIKAKWCDVGSLLTLHSSLCSFVMSFHKRNQYNHDSPRPLRDTARIE